jgi:hypothetical protein
MSGLRLFFRFNNRFARASALRRLACFLEFVRCGVAIVVSFLSRRWWRPSSRLIDCLARHSPSDSARTRVLERGELSPSILMEHSPVAFPASFVDHYGPVLRRGSHISRTNRESRGPIIRMSVAAPVVQLRRVGKFERHSFILSGQPQGATEAAAGVDRQIGNFERRADIVVPSVPKLEAQALAVARHS